jgi:hypothetical protein
MGDPHCAEETLYLEARRGAIDVMQRATSAGPLLR